MTTPLDREQHLRRDLENRLNLVSQRVIDEFARLRARAELELKPGFLPKVRVLRDGRQLFEVTDLSAETALITALVELLSRQRGEHLAASYAAVERGECDRCGGIGHLDGHLCDCTLAEV